MLYSAILSEGIQMTRRERITHRRYKTKRKKRIDGRVGIIFRIFALFVVCVMPFLTFKTAAASEEQAVIRIQAIPGEILQGEEMPQIMADITADGDLNAVLDKEKKENVADLLEKLKKGTGYKIQCEAVSQTEGDYPITITLDENIQSALKRDWIGLVNIEVKDSVFKVKNPIGEWDGDKFKRYDGTYVENDFVVSKGATYYLGADMLKVSGWQDIGDGRYCFADDGQMLTGWQSLENAKYYFAADGKMQKGWLETDGAKYYFGEDGNMLTGEQRIGAAICVFDADGKFVSEKAANVDASKPMVALTFDDGPGPRTGELLGALEKYGARATFFMLGQKVPSHAAEVRKMKDLGCELGNHSYDHADLSKLGADGVQNEVSTTNTKISQAAGTGATVMRPPYGAISQAVRDGVGMPMILWNIDTLDWKTRNAQKTVDAVMASVKDGDVILMHDIHSESVDAAIRLIPMLQQAGYQLVTVSEMAAAKGRGLENGKTYTDF